MNKKEMLQLRLEGRTYQYIAGKAGVSRQRIQQVLAPPPAIRNYVVNKYDGYCSDCGVYVGVGGHVHHEGANGDEDYNDIENLKLVCVSCHRRKHGNPPQFQCLNCKAAIKKGIFCSKICVSQYHTVTLTCSECDKEYSLRTSDAHDRAETNTSGVMFCSKRCFGKWAGKTHGFGSADGRQNRRFNTKKWDYDKVYEARDATGFGAVKLSRLLGMPQGTVDMILGKRATRKTEEGE